MSDCEQFFEADTCRPCRTAGNKHLHKIKTDLWVGNRALAESWDAEANAPYLPEDVAVQSNAVFRFTCECGMQFDSSPNNRWRQKTTDCYDCSRRAVGDKNARPRGKTVADIDFLIAQWDFAANTADPTTVGFRSNKSFFWICDEMKHSTPSTVCNKYKGNGCGICAEKFFESTGERQLRTFIASVVNDEVVKKSYAYTYPYELDAVIPALGKAIEYNGDHWHSNVKVMEKHAMTNVEYHQLKIDKAKDKGVEVAIVWDDEWKKERSAVEADLTAWLTDRKPLSALPRLTRLTSARDR